jgi:hypothetical protein
VAAVVLPLSMVAYGALAPQPFTQAASAQVALHPGRGSGCAQNTNGSSSIGAAAIRGED